MILPIKLLLPTHLSKIEKQKKFNAQLQAPFELFLFNKSFSSHCRLKLQKQLFSFKIKALSVKVLSLYTKILKARNLILNIFVFLDVQSRYTYVKKSARSQMIDLLKAFMLALKAVISIGYMIFLAAKFLLQEICILIKLTNMIKKI